MVVEEEVEEVVVEEGHHPVQLEGLEPAVLTSEEEEVEAEGWGTHTEVEEVNLRKAPRRRQSRHPNLLLKMLHLLSRN